MMIKDFLLQKITVFSEFTRIINCISGIVLVQTLFLM